MDIEISPTETYNKRKTNPGRRSQTSKANAEKARQTRLKNYQEKKMIEEYIRQQAENVMNTKKKMQNPEEILREINTRKPPPEEFEEEPENSEDSEDSEEEIIYVAPTPRKERRKDSPKPEEDLTKKELEALKKELAEMKKNKESTKIEEREPQKESPNKKNNNNLRLPTQEEILHQLANRILSH